ncbi:glucokinase [Pseudooceanicola batsensis HTCC2597]|uniref:Glucokinase n=1 Tax=Pseudooceanicola batsensis (strain ATCC BAA-863 / DSM 15984 / KCTC 12145 / HTCC2597) TaxID=252305 RepID=A3TWQ0_PSEBH|nr:glucokinase [Pseudooceanicola batsensis]EAQ04046.1 glucokinase [Pseudooceanicola batsensis HTCC2597]
MSHPWFLVADIGGSNVRFGAYRDDGRIDQADFRTQSEASIPDLAAQFCDRIGTPPEAAVLAVAGPVRDNSVKITNARHVLSGDDVAQRTGARAVRLINDFSAVAWATLGLTETDLCHVAGPPDLPRHGNRFLIGPGTGLGVGALVETQDGRFTSVASEGGHVGIAPRDRSEIPVFEALRDLQSEAFYGTSLVIEADLLLSGSGLPVLCDAVRISEGDGARNLDAAAVLAAARTGGDAAATRAVDMFRTHLASLAGDFALSFGATGGVFIAGGVATRNPWLFDERFREAFEEGGRFTGERRQFSVFLMRALDIGLEGAWRYCKSWIMQGKG